MPDIKVGKSYTVCVEAMYENPHLVLPNRTEKATADGVDYYDLCNPGGVLAACDGESAVVIGIDGNSVTLYSPDAQVDDLPQDVCSFTIPKDTFAAFCVEDLPDKT